MIIPDPSEIDIPRLIRVVALSHKYDFASYHTWGLNMLLLVPLPICPTSPANVACGIPEFATRFEKRFLTDGIE